MDRTQAGVRVRTRAKITGYVEIPKGTEGTIEWEQENLGRVLIYVNWGKLGTSPVFPEDIEIVGGAFVNEAA